MMATQEELCQVEGISTGLAQRIYDYAAQARQTLLPAAGNKKPCFGGPEPSELHSQCPAPSGKSEKGSRARRDRRQGSQRASSDRRRVVRRP